VLARDADLVCLVFDVRSARRRPGPPFGNTSEADLSLLLQEFVAKLLGLFARDNAGRQ
jgi:hypothetical protein